ncbi:MAG: hypothetical protein NTX03_08590 [Bacteroidetes bacterium]|nr:hypothetical protein [Bacteroidota bacterium]
MKKILRNLWLISVTLISIFSFKANAQNGTFYVDNKINCDITIDSVQFIDCYSNYLYDASSSGTIVYANTQSTGLTYVLPSGCSTAQLFKVFFTDYNSQHIVQQSVQSYPNLCCPSSSVSVLLSDPSLVVGP